MNNGRESEREREGAIERESMGQGQKILKLKK